MFRLTREVRFAINGDEDQQLGQRPSNSFAGHPSLTGAGHYLALRATLAGTLQPHTQYLRNITEIDHIVRGQAIPLVAAAIRRNRFGGGGQLLVTLHELLKDKWAPAALVELRLLLSPFLHLTAIATELPMVRLSQMFEFCAAHRLDNPALDQEQNRLAFGKCNNPNGHGHNYHVQVTIAGKPDANGIIMPVPAFEEIVSATVIDHFDHRNLNLELPQFAQLLPTVENIAMVIHQMLKGQFPANVDLASVTVWESDKTWCEYGE